MEKSGAKILIADDNEQLRNALKELFTDIGYTVVTAKDGDEAAEMTLNENPDLVILDYHMPGKDGFDAVQEIRKHPALTNTPIMILTSDVDRDIKLKALTLDIDDFINKPIDNDEIIARVKLLIKRSRQSIDINPLTKLPGNSSIQTRVEAEIASGRKFAVLYADLNNFKAYNDAYGFKAGDTILIKTADIISNAAKKFDAEAFIGNIGGDDFVIVSDFAPAQKIAEEITKQIEEHAPSFYNEADRARGAFTAVNRMGDKTDFPLLSVSVSVVHNNLKELESFAHVAYIAAELKSYAKSWGGNFIAFDRRSN